MSHLLLLQYQSAKISKCSHHQYAPDMHHPSYGSTLFPRSAFELCMPSGTALGRTEIKVSDRTGLQEGRYTNIKHRHIRTRLFLP